MDTNPDFDGLETQTPDGESEHTNTRTHKPALRQQQDTPGRRVLRIFGRLIRSIVNALTTSLSLRGYLSYLISHPDS